MVTGVGINILTLKWGDKYGPEYANRLYAGVRRHLGVDFRLLCFTDDRSGLQPEIEAHPIPDFDVPPAWQRTPWLKLALFRDDLAGLSGQSLFLDLDILITGRMDDFFTFAPGRPCIIHDWENPVQRLFRRHGEPGNSSVFRFESGKSGAILDRFMAERDQALAQYRTVVDQRYLAEALGPDKAWWPSEWVVSFKRHCIPTYPAQPLRDAPVAAGSPDRRLPRPPEPARGPRRLPQRSSSPELPPDRVDRRALALTGRPARRSGVRADRGRLDPVRHPCAFRFSPPRAPQSRPECPALHAGRARRRFPSPSRRRRPDTETM